MYKTILVHVDATPRSAQRLACGARLAIEHDAHLVGAAATGLSPYSSPYGGLDIGLPTVTFPLAELRAQADMALDAFEQAAQRAGLSKLERRRVDDEVGPGISREALYADLVVVSQPAPGGRLPRLRADVAEYVVLACPRPALIVPAAGFDHEFGRRILVAWNGSAQAVRAITSALPLLRAAGEVTLLVVNPEAEPEVDAEAPGADLAVYLARHDVRIDVVSTSTKEEPGDTVLACAADRKADLIVMGAYGHARFREVLLGGATRTVLRSSRLPIWMVH